MAWGICFAIGLPGNPRARVCQYGGDEQRVRTLTRARQRTGARRSVEWLRLSDLSSQKELPEGNKSVCKGLRRCRGTLICKGK